MRTMDWRRLVGSAAALVPAALVVWAASLFSRRLLLDGSGRAFLRMGSPTLLSALGWTSIGLFVVLAVLAFARFRWRPVPVVVFAAFLFSFGFLLLSAWGHSWVSDDVAVIGPDAAVYRAGGDGDDTYWLARDVAKRWNCTVVEIVAGEQGLGPPVARVIRPIDDRPRTSGSDQLGIRIDRFGRVYFLDGACVLVAYDPGGTPRAPTRGYDENREYLRRGMLACEFSPFVFLGEHDAGNEADVGGFLQTIAAARDDPARRASAGAPTEDVVLAALDDANPWIAATARRFVEKGGKTLYPRATERLLPYAPPSQSTR